MQIRGVFTRARTFVLVDAGLPPRFVVVDAVDEAAVRFSTHHGFVAVPEHPPRLYRQMKDIQASL